MADVQIVLAVRLHLGFVFLLFPLHFNAAFLETLRFSTTKSLMESLTQFLRHIFVTLTLLRSLPSEKK
jgi:hypothetical protein